jgi:hypothetical protein
MARYSVQREFTSWEEVVVEADSLEQAEDIGIENWYDLQPEGVADYEPTYRVQVYEIKEGN